MIRGLSLPRLLGRSLAYRPSRTLAELAALTVSAAVATALLTLYISLDQKLHHQFRAFGANIVVTAPSASPLPSNALAVAQKILGPDGRTIPFAYAIAATENGTPVVVAGTDFAGARAMNSWWQVSRWPPRPSTAAPVQVLTGVRAQRALGADRFVLRYSGRTVQAETVGTLRTGDAEDSRIYLPLAAFRAWTGADPNTLEIQAGGSTQQIEATLIRLRQALPGTEVHAVHQLVEAEANVVSRTRSLMLSSLLLISLTVAISVLATLTASVFERRRDFAVMKALGASQQRVGLLFLLEIVFLALAGLAAGFLLGCGIAWLIGQWNFHASIFPVWRILPAVALLNLLVAAIAAALPMRILRNLEPAALLRGE